MYTYKQCSVCGKWKHVLFFGKTSMRRYHYYRSDCKLCHNKEKRNWNKLNTDHILKYNRRYYEQTRCSSNNFDSDIDNINVYGI